MKQPGTLFLVVLTLLPLTLVSCFGTGQPMGGWSGPTVHDGTIYVGARDGRVVAINSSTQSQQWDYSFTSTTIYTTPIVDSDLVYVGTYGGQVYALTIGQGTERWVYPRTGSIGAIVGRPIIANETIYISSSDGRVYALDTAFGDFKWTWPPLAEKPLAEKLWTSPAVVNDTLYVSTFDGHIYALSTETGDLSDWSFEADAGFASSPVIYEDTIFLGSFDRHLYAIKIGSNVSTWKFPQENPAGNWFWASPIVNEGTVYAGCLDGKLYAIETKTGQKLWECDTGDPIVSSPVLADNLLIVANEAGNVYIINPQTGNSERLQDPLSSNSNAPSINAQIRAPFCAYEGFVYIRGDDNRLYVVDIDEGKVSWNISLAKEE